jgi:hypothetical protein
MNLLRNLELVSVSECSSLVRTDAKTLIDPHDSVDRFSRENVLPYYVVANTWLLAVKEISAFGWLPLKEHMLTKGLVATIDMASKAADEIVHTGSSSEPFAKMILRDIKEGSVRPGRLSPESNIAKDEIATLLFLLRYPKRFSPNGATALEARGLQDFVNKENENKLKQRRELPRHIVGLVRDAMASLLDWDEACKILDTIELTITPGACANCGASLASKLEALAQGHPWTFRGFFGYNGLPDHGETVWEYWNSSILDPVREVKVLAVPKTYKKVRIIAMEDAYRQFVCRTFFVKLDRLLPKQFIDLHDQTRNQHNAWLGSVYHEADTFDMKAFSDSITKTLAWEIFPRKFMNKLYSWIGTHTNIKGKRRRMEMLLTSGHALTFFMESCVAAAVLLASCDYVSLYDRVNYDVVSVYGDDTTVPRNVSETFQCFLEALGLTVNMDKTFTGDHPYRESCGEEYYKGIQVSSVYYPRHRIQGTIEKGVIALSKTVTRDSYTDELYDSTSTLVDLQHRLWGISPSASHFVAYLLKSVHPKMTTSEENEPSTDLWGYISDHPFIGSTYQEGPIASGKRVRNDCKDWEGSYSLGFVPVPYKVTKTLAQAYDCYKYESFLKHGPQYATQLDAILGVSTPPVPITKIGGQMADWRVRF